MKLFVSLFLAYWLGCFNPAYCLARIRGFDIRERGTTNAGATNAMFAMGLPTGILVMLLDIGKTLFAMYLASMLCRRSLQAKILAGVCCAVGHVFPAPMKFRGGKGTACLGGIILYLTPKLFLVVIGVGFVVGLLVDRASLLPVLASAAYPWMFYGVTGERQAAFLLCLMIPLLLWSHRGNFSKYHDGKESGFRKVLFSHDLDSCVERQEQEEQQEEVR